MTADERLQKRVKSAERWMDFHAGQIITHARALRKWRAKLSRLQVALETPAAERQARAQRAQETKRARRSSRRRIEV